MAQLTLADKVKEHSEVKLKSVSVKVPTLNTSKKHKGKQKAEVKKSEQLSLTSLANLIIKASLERAKREKKTKPKEEDKVYKIIKERRPLIVSGGYGTVSKNYGVSQQTSYVDYGKLFSYLGKFKTQNPYEHLVDEHAGIANKALEDSGFNLIGKESMDKIGKYVKYFMPKTSDLLLTASISLVPLQGMSSAEWEQVKMWIKLDPVMYLLKSTTS
ncbi:hypothetical protein HYX02_05485 [Candidatus Woesearchaeota archaeon]|nr:hypothetical protein [Candidatus Woesearchaeota archaeon]